MDIESTEPIKLEPLEPTQKKIKADHTEAECDTRLNTTGTDITEINSEPIATLDPLAYTKTGEFTSEIFKIVIDNIPIYTPPSELRKFLTKLELDPVKIKRPYKKPYAYITFRNEDGRLKALNVLNNTLYRKSVKLRARKAKPTESPFVRNESRGDNKKQDCLSVREKTGPLYKMEYADQLKFKLTEIQSVFNKYKVALKRSWPTGFPEDSYKFIIDEIKPSPTLHGYRNKCEFTVGLSVDSGDKYTVGFVKGKYNDGNISVEAPNECVETCPTIFLQEVERFKEFITISGYPAYDAINNLGVWKALELRTNRDSCVMVTVVVDKRQLEEDDKGKIKTLLIGLYAKKDSSQSTFSVFLKTVGKGEETMHVHGPEVMMEILCGFGFQITSGSFFQVNTEAAEILYETIRDTAELDKDTILLDVCCGTGTIGIILSKFVNHVHGIEIVNSAVEDAKINAKENNIENITFHCGNAKFVTGKVLKSITKNGKHRIVAVVDPPRSGLHGDVVSCLRNNEMITELIYVSCDINQITDNIVNICQPSSHKYGGIPFSFVKASAVDMFPHTRKCEVILHFRREREAS